jgi:eukaryotic-like serine/threonine-protein kinase
MKPTDGATDPTLVDHEPHSGATPTFDVAGYRVAQVIGRGGMGEVILAEDLRIGRPVAIKRMLGERSTPEATARFLREACIQARLEHPAIVPVHELGHDADGRPYFTMKRLAGTTLEKVLATGTTGTNELLRAFVDVCLALDFAHVRGVVHRDMKPANIMLGDYGEVYVLDWGVARLVGDAEATPSGSLADVAHGDSQTQAGAILGTPAYMAPEQMSGQPVGPEADVYALGGILFEMLAGEPANARTGLPLEPSPAARAPDRAIAPELDAICCAALAERPADRPTARQLADRLRAYLDGDRDVALRRTLGAKQIELARAAIESGDPARRADAMAAAGRALALDPSSVDAAALVTQLMFAPPTVLPETLAKRLDDRDLETVERQGRVAAKNLAAYLGFVPLTIWVGIRDWGVMSAIWTLNVFIMIGSMAMARRQIRSIGWAMLANSLALGLASRMFGSFVLLPALVVNASVSLVAFPTLLRKPVLVLATMLGAYLIPLALEATGFWERTWWLAGGTVVTRPTAIDLSGTPAAIYLIVGGAAIIVVTSLYVRSIALAQRAAQRQLDIQAWHLEQLLPARPAAAM